LDLLSLHRFLDPDGALFVLRQIGRFVDAGRDSPTFQDRSVGSLYEISKELYQLFLYHPEPVVRWLWFCLLLKIGALAIIEDMGSCGASWTSGKETILVYFPGTIREDMTFFLACTAFLTFGLLSDTLCYDLLLRHWLLLVFLGGSLG